MPSFVRGLINKAIEALKGVWQREPVRVVAVIVSAVITAAGAFGFIVPAQTVETIVAAVLSVLLGGEVSRSRVTPTK